MESLIGLCRHLQRLLKLRKVVDNQLVDILAEKASVLIVFEFEDGLLCELILDGGKPLRFGSTANGIPPNLQLSCQNQQPFYSMVLP